VAEREAELIALQSAFDEYIASSRELEEELDAELAKMREYKLLLILVLNWNMTFFGGHRHDLCWSFHSEAICLKSASHPFQL